MWKLFMRLMAPDDDKGGGGGGQGGGAGSGTGDDKGGKGAGAGDGDKGGILASGGKGAGAGAGDDKGGKGGAGDGTGGAGDKTPWLWADGTPGVGDRPAWYKGDKYKTIAAQAEAAVAHEAKLGKAAELIGAPVDAEGKPAAYALPDVKGVKELDGWEWDAEDPLLKGFQAEAAAMGLSQKAFDKIATMYAKGMAEQQEAAELHLSEALQKLGPNVEQRVAAVQQFITAKIGAEGFATLDAAIGTNVEAFQALAQIVGLASNDARLAGGGGSGGGVGFTRKDIETEQFKTYDKGHPLAGQRVYDHDAEHRKKVDGMWGKLFPGEDVQQVG